MSTLPNATGRVWPAFLLTVALAALGSIAYVGASTASAQEREPVPTAAPQDDSSAPALIAPAPDDVDPAPDEVGPVQERQPVTEETLGDASGSQLIAPAPDAAGQDVIAPAPSGGDSGNSWWVYGLLAAAALATVAGAGTVAWRLRRHRA